MQAVPRGRNNRVINEVGYEEEIEKSSGSHHYFRTALMLASPHVVTFEAVARRLKVVEKGRCAIPEEQKNPC
jgi:hypothetical protein